MSQLIDELKRDHEAMESMLAKAKDSRISHAEAHKILAAARTSLLAHLKKEDIRLYPVLSNAAQNNGNLKRTMDFYAKDMEDITRTAIAFFDKYAPANAVIDIEFARAFGNLFATLSRRMRNEENTLYQEYEKLNP